MREAFPDLPVVNVRSLADQVDRQLQEERLLATLAGAFGVAALFLVALGLYGVIAEWAAQRTVELGVRMALGATPAGLRWLVLRQALLLVAGGVAVGVPAALAGARLLKEALYGVRPTDPVAPIAASLVLFAVAGLAAYLPARRASRIDPIAALRSE